MKRNVLKVWPMVALVLSLTACGSGEDNPPAAQSVQPTASAEASEPTKEAKEEAYEITYTSAKTYADSIGGNWVQVIVEIENTGGTDLYLSTSSYDLEDENGNLVSSSSMVSVYPDVIAPGEKGYMYEETMLDEPVEGELAVVARPNVEKATVENIRYDVTDVELFEDKYGSLKAKGRVENAGSEEESMIYVVLILKDGQGTPIGQIFTILMEDLAPGDKIGFEASDLSLPDDVTVDAVADYEVFAYPNQMQF